MRVTEAHSKSEYILYDAERIENPVSSYFELEYWHKCGGLTGTAEGRGTTVFVQLAGEDYVLRHYRRGGMIARLLEDCYLWTGLEQTRAWREWHLLAELYKRDLPVPAPIAARVRQIGLLYRADILLAKIPETQTLADILMKATMDSMLWNKLGQCLKTFHAQGVFHADLNARNILLDEQGKFYLIDFDRGDIRQPRQQWQQDNCLRLKRSLDKFVNQALQKKTDFYFTEADWKILLDGYEGNS